MKKRDCKRFSIPGTTLFYRERSFFSFKEKYSDDYFPVVDLSKGGAKFLCHERLTPGKAVIVKLNIPGNDKTWEINASIRWISKNPEQSYRYQTGISFNPFGTRKDNNPMEILSFLENLEGDAEKKS
ncbi:PilZ domain-containing protein [Desulfospira joergensenii]|uniref:PilZ domain-containing protein n=1 Tax=Desulfospira joergensenii TaxID=53329 RepID=UPI0003B31743|nr:PilZ domain-containing protein [Desulfospira joergensenii]